MLFKNLRAIMNEADEAPTPPEATTTPDQNTPVEKTTVTPSTPAKFETQAKKNSDGIRNEVYDAITKLIPAITATINNLYSDLKINIEVVKGFLMITFENPVEDEETQNTLIQVIMQVVTAALDTKIDDFSLTDPTFINPKSLTFVITAAKKIP